MSDEPLLLDNLEVEIAPFASSDSVYGGPCAVVIAAIIIYTYQQVNPV